MLKQYYTQGGHMFKYILLVVVLSLTSFNVSASVYIYNIGTTFDGTSPGGSAPWLTAKFSDVGVNTVQLDLSTSGLIASEKVGAWYFNFTPLGNVNSLVFTRLTGFPPGNTTVTLGANSQAADGGGLYDIELDFPTGQNPFGANQSLSYMISSSNSLNASMFNELSVPHGGNGVWLTAAHVQSINGNSGWIGTNKAITTPEPETYLTLISLLSIAWVSRRRAMTLTT